MCAKQLCTLLFFCWQLINASVVFASEAAIDGIESPGDAIFYSVSNRYRKLDGLRSRGKVEVLFQDGKRTVTYFEIVFIRGKELFVKTRNSALKTPAIGAYEKDFRIRDGQAREFLLGIETERHDTSPEDFVKTKIFHYSLIPATLPILLLRDESIFFARHAKPTGWMIEPDDNLPVDEARLRFRWPKGQTIITVSSRDQKLLTCKFEFRLAGLKSAFFEFEQEDGAGGGKSEVDKSNGSGLDE